MPPETLDLAPDAVEAAPPRFAVRPGDVNRVDPLDLRVIDAISDVVFTLTVHNSGDKTRTVYVATGVKAQATAAAVTVTVTRPAQPDTREGSFMREHGLADVVRFADMAAATVFGAAVRNTARELDTDRDTGRPYLFVQVRVDVPREEYIAKRNEYLNLIWSQFPQLDPELVLFSVRRARP